MNIISAISYPYGLMFYGKEDLSNSWEIKYVLEHQKEIDVFLGAFKLNTLFDIDTYITYLWLKKESQLREILPLIIKDELRDQVGQFLNKIDSIISKFKIGDINKFIINNYTSIFNDYEDSFFHFDLIRLTIDWIYEHSNTFKNKEVLIFIEEKFWYLIVDNIAYYFDFYKKNLDRFEKRVLNESIASQNLHNYNRIFDLLMFLSDKESVSELSRRVASFVCEKVLKEISDIDKENYLIRYSLYDQGIMVARKYKLNIIYDYENFQTKIETVGIEYFETYGHKIVSEPVDVSDFLKQLKESRLPVIVRFILLTHLYSKDVNNFVSIFENTMKTESPLTDSITHVGLESNEYFTPSRLMQIDYIMKLNTVFMKMMLVDEELFDMFFNNYYSVLSNLVVDGTLAEVDLHEFNGMCSMIKSILDLGEDIGFINGSLYYGVSMLISTFTEKLLRKLFNKLKTIENYIDIKFQTIGTLLEYNDIKKYIGQDLSNVLKYFLSIISGTRIGLNLRNNLMHNNLDFDVMSIDLPVQMLFILTNLMNAIAIHYIASSPPQLD